MNTPALSRSGVDRVAHRRKDEQWLAEAWTSGRLLVVDDQRRAWTDDHGLVLTDTTSYDGDRFLLGVDGEGVVYWGGVGQPVRPLGARPVTIRDVGATLSDRDAGLLVSLIGLANWHATHTRCPRCGEPTRIVDAGWVRRCDNDGSDHFPRISIV